MSPVASTRWCPTAEQIMILEEMYRGGIRTPNAAQIQHITAHLSLYGKIEGKNVFYWFQNHKARDRQKLRKRLLGKQLHLHLQQPQPQPHQQQQQHQQQKQTTLHAQLPNNVSIVDELSSNFQQHPPNYHNFLHQLHFDETPLPPRYPLTPPFLAGLHQLHNFDNSPPSRVANHQARTHSYTWKLETIEANNGREKSRPIRITHDDDWIMIGDHDDDNDDDGRGHEMSGGTTTRPLKTLQLFPIKEKTSLKEHHLSPPSHFHTYF